MSTDAIATELADAALAAQRAHVFANPTACSCGYEPDDLADWERHRLLLALAAFVTALDARPDIRTLIAASSLGAALAAAPRSSALPTIPADVKRVRDKDGTEWVRVSWSVARDWEIDTVDSALYAYASEADLIADNGPLTEVPDV